MRLRTRLLFGGIAVIIAIAPFFVPLQTASAAQITVRSLTLQAGAGGDGGSKPGGSVNHLFTFTLPTAGTVGSVLFEYCTTTAGTCTTPTGLDTTGAAIADQTGATGFTLNNSTNGAPYITRTAASISADTDVTYELSSVTNPTTPNETFFVRITSYTGTDGSTGPVDRGVVAASTASQIVISGVMPESLIFCTGGTVSTTLDVPDCTTATSGLVEFDQLFSPSDTATASSQMAASTNAGFGYNITVNGTTLTSGANSIAAMTTPGPISRGTAQFGINLVENTAATSTVPVGANVNAAPDGVDLKGQPAADYDTPDEFKFVSGDVVADSANGGAGPTNAQIFTVSYIVNVPGNQSAGTYTTTLSYICTANF